MTEKEQVLRKTVELGEKFRNAKTLEEKSKIASDITLLTIVATTRPSDWENADKVLVEVQIPKMCTKIFESVKEAFDVPVAEMESNLINLIVSVGLPHLAIDTLVRMGIVPKK